MIAGNATQAMKEYLQPTAENATKSLSLKTALTALGQTTAKHVSQATSGEVVVIPDVLMRLMQKQ